jgi:hypothetical protein
MASNEHKNLTDINRHNPMGFENATNETVLSKDGGTSPTGTDGNLVWQRKSLMGVNNYKMQGFTTGALNYKYGEDISDTKSPFEMAVDYGSSAVASGTINPSDVFRIGQGIVIPEISNVVSINGWITSNTTNDVTIAICKATPVAGVVDAIVPIVIDEITLEGDGDNKKLVNVSETTITTSSLAVGDIIFPMIKEDVAGSTIYMNINIQTTTF